MRFQNKTIRTISSLLAVTVFFGSCNLCNLSSSKKLQSSEPTPTPQLLESTPAPPPEEPTPTPQLVQSLSIGENNDFTVSTGAGEAQVVVASPDETDNSGLQVSTVKLDQGAMVVVTDPQERYLPEIRFLSDVEEDPVRLIPKMRIVDDQEPLEASMYIAHDVTVERLMDTFVGETTLGDLFAYLTSYAGDGGAFGLLIDVSGGVTDDTQVSVYQTPVAGVFLVLPSTKLSATATGGHKLASPQQNFLIGALVVLTFVVLPALPLVKNIQGKMEEVEVADFTGLTTKDIYDMQYSVAVSAFGQTGGEGQFGEGVIAKAFLRSQAKDVDKYIESVKIVDKPCGSVEYLGKIFSQDPPPGSTIVPMDDEVVLYLCSEVNTDRVKVVTVSFSGVSDDCPPQPALPQLDVVLVIDVSGSMEGSRLAAAKSSAINFVGQLNPQTDRVGLVSFTSDASVLSQLTGDFGSITGMIGGFDADDGTSIADGLAAGHGVVRSGGRPDAMPVVMLLSDGQSDPDAAHAAAGQIKSDGAILLTVGVGEGTDQGLLGSLASAPTDFLFSRSNQGLRELFSETALRLTTGRVLARDVTITLTVDTSRYAIVDRMLTNEAKITSFGVIEWQVPVVYEGQSVIRPVVVRPLKADDDATVGTAVVSYGQCEDGPQVTSDPIPVEQVDPMSLIQPEDVLKAGSQSSGTMHAYDSKAWVIDVDRPGLYSVVVQGAGSELPPEIFTGDGQEYLYPLYSVSTSTDSKSTDTIGSLALPGRSAGLLKPAFAGDTRINVYFIENPKMYWFYLQSNSPEDSGPFALKLQEGAADDSPILNLGDEPLSDSIDDAETKVYALQGLDDAEAITAIITYEQEDSYFYAHLVSLDGETVGYQYSLQGRDGTPSIFSSKVTGEGPYRLVVYHSGAQGEQGDFTLRVERGDALSMDKGLIEYGDIVQESLQPGHVDTWQFEGKSGDGLVITADNLPGRETLEVDILNPDGEAVSWDSDRDQVSIGPLELDADGTYTIVVQYYYNADSSGSYTLSLESVELPDLVFEAISPGETVEGTIIEGREDRWTFEAMPGQTATILLVSPDSELNPELVLLGPNGDPVSQTMSYYGQAQLGPIELAQEGVYTIVVSGSYSAGPYELTLDLSGSNTSEQDVLTQ